MGLGEREDKVEKVLLTLGWALCGLGQSKVSEVNYKVAKPSTPAKVRYLHFNMLKPYVEENPQSNEASHPKRPTPSRSVRFFDDPGIRDGEMEMAIGETHELRPLRLPTPRLPPNARLNDKHLESLNPIEDPNQIEAEVVETYDAAELETRREDDHSNAPADQELAPPELRGEHEAEGEGDLLFALGLTSSSGANSNPNQTNTTKTFFPRYTH